MAFERYVNNFDYCAPPICDGDITVTIKGMHCANDTLTVSWIISDRYNRTFSNFDFNNVLWSVNTLDFDLTEGVYNSNSPYEARIDLTDITGIVHLKASVSISGTTFTSLEETFDINDCTDESVNMVLATLCQNCNPPQDPTIYDLYVREESISSVPAYFKYQDLCWYIDQNAMDEKILIPSDTTSLYLISDIGSLYDSCTSCCYDLTCPSEWVDDGTGSGEMQANFYIEYITFWRRDRVVVYKNYDGGECADQPDTNIIWDSGCVGTSRRELTGDPTYRLERDCIQEGGSRPCTGEPLGEGTGEYRPEAMHRSIHKDDGGPWVYSYHDYKSMCFLVHEDDRPLGISIIPLCDGPDATTAWCAYIEGPDGYKKTECDGLEGICTDIDSSSSSSESSSSSSQSSSISSLSSSSSESSSSSSESSSSSDSSNSSSSSQSSSSSNSSSVASSSSSQSSSSSTSSATHHHLKPEAFLLREFTEEEIEELYAMYHPMLVGLTSEEKEDKLVDLVSDGTLSADKALVIAIKEGLIIES